MKTLKGVGCRDLLHGAVSSLWLASLVQATTWGVDDRLKVVVTRDQNQLNQMETELAFCGVDAYVFPDWETLTYDELSPHQDIVSERINLLTDMPTSGGVIHLCTGVDASSSTTELADWSAL